MRLFLALCLSVLVSSACFAADDYKLLAFSSDVSTSGGKTITANIPAVSGRKIVVFSVIGRSDLSTSIVSLQEADASGTTGNYTTRVRWDNGAATTQRTFEKGPIVGKIGYGYRFLLDSTTANSLLVVYTYQ